jgi:hypothetical protein
VSKSHLLSFDSGSDTDTDTDPDPDPDYIPAAIGTLLRLWHNPPKPLPKKLFKGLQRYSIKKTLKPGRAQPICPVRKKGTSMTDLPVSTTMLDIDFQALSWHGAWNGICKAFQGRCRQCKATPKNRFYGRVF